MTTKSSQNLDVSSWLAELHMECYKKNLENYETIKPLLELREPDIKKLGVLNSKDRARMMTSLANYRSHKQTHKQTPITALPGPVSHIQDSHKSLLRKGSLKKLNIRSFLSSGSSKKNKSSKKMAESVQISDLSVSTAIPTPSESSEEVPASSAPPPTAQVAVSKPPSSVIADYEELPDVVSPLQRSMTLETTKSFHVPRQPAVENEYVPSPENSPQFSAHRYRANTIATPLNPEFFQRGGSVAPMHLQSSQSSASEFLHHQRERGSSEEDSPGQPMHKHLSVVSMESGLSFGYDVEKDFNPSQPLEAQPWFHGKISRADAELLLHDDGDFVVRENTTMSNTFTLTLRWRGVADHTLIGTTEVISTTSLIRGSTVKYQFDSGAFDSIPELIYNHLKYQIPVETSQHTLITNPVCRPGNPARSSLYSTNLGVYVPQRSTLSPESSPAPTSSLLGVNAKRRSGSPSEISRLRLGKMISLQDLPPRSGKLSKHLSNSSGDLLEASKEGVKVSLRNVISPPPDTRGRAMTISHPGLRQSASASGNVLGARVLVQGNQSGTGNHQKVDSFGDYEVMESVSILKESPSLGTRTPHPSPSEGEKVARVQTHTLSLAGEPSHHRPHSAGNTLNRLREREVQSAGNLLSRSHQRESQSAGNSLNRSQPREKVQYAEIRYFANKDRGPVIKSGPNTVNYAEVRFRSNTVSASPQKPHPFSLYDTVPPGRREATPPRVNDAGPYQSRAEVLAQRLHAEPTYAIPNPSAVGKRPATAHAKTNYASIQFAQQSSLPSTPGSTSNTSSPLVSTSQSHITEATLYSTANRQKMQELSSSNDSLLSSASSSRRSTSPSPKHVMGSSLLNHSHAPSAKVHRSLPGYETLVKTHTILQNHSNDELAYHMTRTDAVCFLLAPRPGEDKDIWRDRVKHVMSSSGLFCGLQTLAEPEGEKFWRKLYFRHLNLSQTVTLTVITAGDALERARLLRRFIDVAQLLHSHKYGNLFSFIGVMQGLAAPQLTSMSELWDLLKSHFPEEFALYKILQSKVLSIDQGELVLPIDQLVIPPIQHLKPVFHFTEQSMVGFVPIHPDHSIVGELMSVSKGMEALRTIVANTTSFTLNAWKSLQTLQYNASLMEFFTQDFTRLYLQSIGVQSDDPLERRRRFGLLMDALIDRVESSEAV